MMLEIEMEEIRDVKKLVLKLPYSKGLYAVTGINGIGKSTIFSALARVVYRGALTKYFRNDGSSRSRIVYRLNGVENEWIKRFNWQRADTNLSEVFVNGVFEGGLIFGSRFSDAHTSKIFSTTKIKNTDICDANQFVKENLGIILRDDATYYSGLKRIKNKEVAVSLGFAGIPYLVDRNGVRIHQFRMSSGEFLLVGLLHYIHQRIEYTSRNRISELSVVLLDEIELALHPSAQNRLAIFLNRISADYNFCVYFATHSIQILANIRPDRIYHLDYGVSGAIEVINPCYPAYATRCMYFADGFDFLLLVEDELAKHLVEKSIKDRKLLSGKLIKVLPCGGWEKTLELQLEVVTSRLAGASCQVVSILDGDIRGDYEDKYEPKSRFSPLSKRFLPIKSLEKYLKKVLVTEPDDKFAREFGDLFYRVRSIYDIVFDYRKNPKSSNDNNGKGLFLVLKSCAIEQGHDENVFVKELCNFISDFENLEGLAASIEGICNESRRSCV